MRIFICNLVILFITFLDSVQSVEPPVVTGATDLRTFRNGQVVSLDRTRNYRVVDNNRLRELDIIDWVVFSRIKSGNPSNSEEFIVPSFKLEPGCRLMRIINPRTRERAHLGTVDNEGIIRRPDGTPVDPIDTDHLFNNHGQDVALHMNKRWHQVLE